MNQNQESALKILKGGGIIAYPTDTTFGIGCDISFVNSIRRIQEIKGRDIKKAMSIACSNLQMAKKYADISNLPEQFLEKIFPGPVTLLLAKTDSVSDTITGGSRKVGLRMPDYPELLELIAALDHPIITTSANLSGDKDPIKDSEVKLEMDYIYPGECTLKKPSTIIDIESKSIVREGVNAEKYKDLLNLL
jgi:L-threonylcarbamoyladenylate synthase